MISVLKERYNNLQTKVEDKAASDPTGNKPSKDESLNKGYKFNGGKRPKKSYFLGLFRGLYSLVFGQLLFWATKLTVGLVDLHFYGQEHILECRRQGRPIIFAAWHGHNLVTMYAYYAKLSNDFKCVIMVPESKNGMVLNYYGKKINIDVVRVKAELGPSQWARATVAMIKLMRTGYCAMLSPDGPSGPPYKVKPGIARIGQQAKAVVIPASAAANRAVRLRNRWDEHLVPLPFSRTVVHFGPPIDMNPANGPYPCAEELQERIEEALLEGARKAEELCRRSSKEGVR